MLDISFVIVGLVFFLNALTWVIIISVLASWFAPYSQNPIVRFMNETAATVLRPIRRIVPPTAGIDWSPLVAIILIDVVKYIIQRMLS